MTALPTYVSRGLRLHYETLGAGRPVLLVHGFTNLGLAWAPQLTALVHGGHRVILPDLAGHGLSQPVAETTTVADLAADLVAMLDHLGVDRTAAVGLSLGGMVAQELAVRRPERLTGILVADSAARFDGADQAQAVAAWIRLLEQPDGARKRLAAAWPLLAGEAFRASASGAAFYASWQDAQARVSGFSLAHVARGMLRFDATARLPSLHLPSRVVVGEEDPLLPPEVSRVVADLIPGARLAVIPGGGHLSNVDRPAEFNRELLEFLAGLG